MPRRIFIKLLLLLTLVGLMEGCSWVGNLFGSKKEEKPPEALAQEGIKKLKKKNYDDAIDAFEKLKDRYPYSDQALLAEIKVADAKFYKRNYDEALEAYRSFEKLHPTNNAIPYVIFQQGMCFYRQRSTIDRDQTFTARALQEFRRLKQKFPESEFIPKADEYSQKCLLDLAEHEFYVGEFYYKTEHYESALDRFLTVEQEYPDYPKMAQVKKYIAECQKILASPEKKSEGGFLSYFTYLFDADW
ncbi:MAG: outer membrane protein assembly factor BamD [Desulfobacca sp.]|nr:outer membrane protein assembly factor BamD [Desulfobacca sp.]